MSFSNHIIIRIRNGDQSAERYLYDCTCEELMATARRYVYQNSAAKDVLQETYIRIFKGLPKLQLVSTAHTWSWMKKIVAGESIRWIKKHQRINERSATYFQLHGSYQVIQNTHHDYMAVLNDLEEKERLVFNLHAIEGYQHAEIASMLNISESNSRVILRRARIKLQNKINTTKSHDGR